MSKEFFIGLQNLTSSAISVELFNSVDSSLQQLTQYRFTVTYRASYLFGVAPPNEFIRVVQNGITLNYTTIPAGGNTPQQIAGYLTTLTGDTWSVQVNVGVSNIFYVSSNSNAYTSLRIKAAVTDDSGTLSTINSLAGNQVRITESSYDYNGLLTTFLKTPLAVAKLDLFSDTASQLNAGYNYIERDPKGDGKDYEQFYRIDPYQNNSFSLLLQRTGDKEFVFNGYNSIQFSLAANTQLKMYYPYRESESEIVEKTFVEPKEVHAVKIFTPFGVITKHAV